MQSIQTESGSMYRQMDKLPTARSNRCTGSQKKDGAEEASPCRFRKPEPLESTAVVHRMGQLLVTAARAAGDVMEILPGGHVAGGGRCCCCMRLQSASKVTGHIQVCIKKLVCIYTSIMHAYYHPACLASTCLLCESVMMMMMIKYSS